MADKVDLFPPRGTQFDPTAKGRARAALGQGALMGWGDEAEAWLRSRMGQGSYEDQLRAIRGETAQYGKDFPVTSAALEFAGGALPGVLVPGAQPAAVGSTLKTLGRMSGMGAATGAVAGAGSAEEGQRGAGAGSGAIIGGAAGAALPLALKGASAGRRWLMERLFPTEARVTELAARKLNRALEQGEVAPGDLPTLLAADRARGVPSRLLNVSPATVDLAEAVAQRTGKGAHKMEEGLTAQKMGSRERTYQQVSRGLQPGDFYADEQRLVEDLRKRAGPMYDTAYAHGSVDDPAINAVLKDPEFAGFFGKAKEIANKEALAAKLRGEDPSKYQLEDLYNLVLDPATQTLTPVLRRLPDVRTLDYVKRGIDATVDSMYSSGRSAEASALKQLRNQFVSTLDKNVPAYAQARKGYAGDMEVIDAMRTGMNDFNKLDHEQVSKLVSGMGAAEKEAFRTGVARNLYSRIMDPSGNFNAAQRIIGSPETQAKLQPLFDNPGQFQLFKTALERESQLFHQANRVLGGSQTGKRAQMREQFEGTDDIGSAIGAAVTGGFWNSLTSTGLRALRNTEMPEKTATKLSDMLLARDPHEVAAVVKLLEEQAAAAAPQALRAGATERGAVTGTASAIWPSPTVQRAQPEQLEDQPSAAPEGPMSAEDLHNELMR